jgi:hypothetical protein
MPGVRRGAVTALALGSLIALGAPIRIAGAQLPPPTAAVVQARARAAHLDVSQATRTTLGGRTATFTPVAEADRPANAKALESGAVLGVLGLTGSGATLPAGQYNVYLSRNSNGWEAALEQAGRIVTVSRAVTIASYPIEHGIAKPMITASDSASGSADRSPANPLFAFASYRPSPGAAALNGSVTITEAGPGWRASVVLLLR